jgi:hypothetical protein
MQGFFRLDDKTVPQSTGKVCDSLQKIKTVGPFVIRTIVFMITIIIVIVIIPITYKHSYHLKFSGNYIYQHVLH